MIHSYFDVGHSSYPHCNHLSFSFAPLPDTRSCGRNIFTFIAPLAGTWLSPNLVLIENGMDFLIKKKLNGFVLVKLRNNLYFSMDLFTNNIQTENKQMNKFGIFFQLICVETCSQSNKKQNIPWIFIIKFCRNMWWVLLDLELCLNMSIHCLKCFCPLKIATTLIF